MKSDNYTFLIIAIVVAILIMIITTSRDVLEHIENKSNHTTSGWVRLYEGWDQKTNPPTSRKWIFEESAEFKNDPKKFGKILDIQLRSYDIAVPQKGKIELWAIYPESLLPGQSTGFYSDFLNPYFNAQPTKYRKIVDVQGGQRVRGNVDFPIKRVLVKGTF